MTIRKGLLIAAFVCLLLATFGVNLVPAINPLAAGLAIWVLSLLV